MKTVPEIEAEQRAIWRQARQSAGLLACSTLSFWLAHYLARQPLPSWYAVLILIAGAAFAARVVTVSFEMQRRNDAVKEALREIEARQRMEGTK